MMRRILPVLLVAALAWTGTASAADSIDEAAALPADEAVPRLEELLEEALAGKRAQDALHIRRHLGRLYVSRGEPYAALVHLEAAAGADLDGDHALDRTRYGEALLATARKNIQNQGIGRSVNPFLRDAIAAARRALEVEEAPLRADAARRAHLVLVEAYYRLGELERAATAWEAARAAGPEAGPALHDWLARIRYAQERWAAAAEAFEKAGNGLGAAAAWDAARKPERSIPLYARAIAAAPANEALFQQALRGVRYTGAHGALLDALQDVETPDGSAGVPLLLARADLMEAVGRAADALPLLREAGTRDERDARPFLRLGRLEILAGNAEDEAVWDAAADAYIEAIRRSPENRAAADGLSWIASRDYGRLWSNWRDERVTSRCVRVQEALVAAMPDDALAWMNLGNTLRVLGRTEDALAAYDRAVEANPFDPAVRSDRGLALSAAGRAQAALAAFEKSLELDGSHLAGRQNAARALWLTGDDDRAEAHLGAAIRTARAIGRSAGTYRYLLGRIWRTRQDPRLR